MLKINGVQKTFLSINKDHEQDQRRLRLGRKTPPLLIELRGDEPSNEHICRRLRYHLVRFVMAITLTFCALCTQSRPDFVRIVSQLQREHPEELCIVELNCMAACDDVPAALLETDYFPRVQPEMLYHAIKEQLTCVKQEP